MPTPQKPWLHAPRTRYLLTNANLVDPKDGGLHSHVTIELRDGLIHRMVKVPGPGLSPSHASPSTPTRKSGVVAGTPSSSPVPNLFLTRPEDPDHVTVDLTGKFIMPGLIDCHVHLSTPPGEEGLRETLALGGGGARSMLRQAWLAREILGRGFTTVRDCGGAGAELREAMGEGVFPGPRLFIAGRAISQTGGHGDFRRGEEEAFGCCGGSGEGRKGLGRVADGVEGCLRAARDEVRLGADFLKIMVSGGVVSPTDAIGDSQFTAEEIRAVVAVGNDCGRMVTAHAYTVAAVRRAVEAGVMGIEHGNLIDEGTAGLMAERGVFLTPTLCTYEAMASPEFGGFLPGAIAGKNLQVLEAGLRSVQLADRAGVTMCYGTDLLGPLQKMQSREFALRKQAGLSNLKILQSATVNAARMLGQGNRLGRIKEGFVADLLVLNANPLEDIEVLSQPERHLLAVIKDGRILESRWSKMTKDSEQYQRIE